MNSRVLALDSGAAGGSSLFSATNSSTSSASCIYSNNHNNRRVGRTSHGSNRRIRVSASLAAPNSTTDSEGSNGLAGAANYAQYACNKVGQAWQSLWGSSEIKGFQQHWYTFAQTMESAFAFNYRHKVTSPTAPPVPETLPHMAAMSTSYPTLHGSHNLDTEALQREELERFLERARNVQPVCDIYNRDGCDLEQCSLQVNELMREAQLRFEASDEEVWDKMYHLETLLEEMELHSSDADEDLEAPSTPVTPKNTTADLTAQSVLAPSKEDKQLSPV